MTKLRRITDIAFSLIMILGAIIILAFPKEGYSIVILILSLVLTVKGISSLVYFFTMARFMVGGRLALYEGVILLDFGLLSMSLSDVPRIYVLIYLVVIHAFSGLVEILRSREARGVGGRGWRLKFSHGLVNILMAAACIAFIKQPNTVVIIYSIGLIYSALMRIINSFRRTTMVYIQ